MSKTVKLRNKKAFLYLKGLYKSVELNSSEITYFITS